MYDNKGSMKCLDCWGTWSTNGSLTGRLRGAPNRGVRECTTAPDEELADAAAPWSGGTLPTEPEAGEEGCRGAGRQTVRPGVK